MVKYSFIIIGLGLGGCFAGDRYQQNDNFLTEIYTPQKQKINIPNFHLIDGGGNNEKIDNIKITKNINNLEVKQLIIGNHSFLIKGIQKSQQDFQKRKGIISDPNLKNNSNLNNIDDIFEKSQESYRKAMEEIPANKEIFLSSNSPKNLFFFDQYGMKQNSNKLFFTRDVVLDQQSLQKSPEEFFYDQVKQGAYYLLQEILRNSFDAQDVIKVLKDLIKGTTEFSFSKLNQSGKIPDSIYDEIYKNLNSGEDFTQTFKDVSKCSAFFTSLGQKVGDQLVISHQLNDTQKLLISTGFTTVGQIFGNIVPVVFKQTEAVEQGLSNGINNLLGRIMGCCVNSDTVIRN
jgi:hypothetical protein